MTPKESVLAAEPQARLDFYEILRHCHQPCWFIRVGHQGPALSSICATPREAWADAYQGLMDSLKRRRA